MFLDGVSVESRSRLSASPLKPSFLFLHHSSVFLFGTYNSSCLALPYAERQTENRGCSRPDSSFSFPDFFIGHLRRLSVSGPLAVLTNFSGRMGYAECSRCLFLPCFSLFFLIVFPRFPPYCGRALSCLSLTPFLGELSLDILHSASSRLGPAAKAAPTRRRALGVSVFLFPSFPHNTSYTSRDLAELICVVEVACFFLQYRFTLPCVVEAASLRNPICTYFSEIVLRGSHLFTLHFHVQPLSLFVTPDLGLRYRRCFHPPSFPRPIPKRLIDLLGRVLALSEMVQ